jgi:hypothetical protein
MELGAVREIFPKSCTYHFLNDITFSNHSLDMW